jgi:NADP-dependent 3-hydroxy acid dehydrogenase YdfG
MSGVADKTVLVTGASSGIGLATARQLAEEGAVVHAAARRAEEIAAQLGDAVTAHALDVTDAEAVAALAEELHAAGPLHAVVHAAGTNIRERAIDDLSPAGCATLVGVNLTGAFHVLHSFRPLLGETDGILIIVGSVSGEYPDASGPGYQAAKSGVHMLLKSAAFDEQLGVRYSLVAPGLVDTPILENRPVKPDAETLAKALKPEDVADVCVYVAGLPDHICVPELTVLPSRLQRLGRNP